MLERIYQKLIPDADHVTALPVRRAYGVFAGIVGIICNLLLFTVKLVIGVTLNSIAIISDAFNNLSDSGSSLIAVISARMASRRPDREHPFGHGRIEYVASLIIAFLILLVGVELFKNSLDKIIHPTVPSLNYLSLAILLLSIFVKLFMFFLNRSIGRKIASGVQLATARDSLNDAITTFSVVVATLLAAFIGGRFPVDGVAGLLISLLVLYSGYGIARNTINTLLGSRPDPELIANIARTVLDTDEIVGMHDLIVHDYGPGRVMASLHAEVPDTINLVHMHDIIDGIESRLQEQLGIEVVIHADPITVNDEATNRVHSCLVQEAKHINPAFNIHDFRMVDGESHINLIFDLVIPCEMTDAQRTRATTELRRRMQTLDPRYNLVIHIDDDFSLPAGGR